MELWMRFLIQPLNIIINSLARVMSRRWNDAEIGWNVMELPIIVFFSLAFFFRENSLRNYGKFVGSWKFFEEFSRKSWRTTLKQLAFLRNIFRSLIYAQIIMRPSNPLASPFLVSISFPRLFSIFPFLSWKPKNQQNVKWVFLKWKITLNLRKTMKFTLLLPN